MDGRLQGPEGRGTGTGGMRRVGCDEWRSTRRAFGARAAAAMPVPAEALEGLGRLAEGGGLTRRDLLERGAGLVLLSGALATLSPRAVMEAAAAQAAAAPDATILVSLYLDGGNDGLNTLVPLRDPRYPVLRRTLAVAPETTLPLPDTGDFGWHPSVPEIADLYRRGMVAVLPSVDYATPDQSHFNSASFWRTGVVGPTHDRTGWLGRTIDAVGTADNPLQAVSVSGTLDPVLQSRRAAVGTVHDPGAFSFWMHDVWGADAFTRPYREASRGGRGRGLVAAQRAYRNAFDMVDMLRPLRTDREHPLPPVPVAYPDSPLGRKMRNLARMLGAGFGTRIAAVSSGGFDTHDDQAAEHPGLLADLSTTLGAFQADLGARGLAHRVLTLVWSEFGRRPQENGTGTDHGAGGLLLLVGERANGGIRSEWPGLATLDPRANLRVTTEFRTVYASLLEQWLAVEAARILPRIDGGRLPLVRPA
ncbi:MAG TPA: DUF1501 domain-containing protein [Miltoncostaeaceae bacterium]|nr:DUF1501 domain-containing protein [Miltoncostaeaceae bacterium]